MDGDRYDDIILGGIPSIAIDGGANDQLLPNNGNKEVQNPINFTREQVCNFFDAGSRCEFRWMD
jgi:hypothetical protein